MTTPHRTLREAAQMALDALEVATTPLAKDRQEVLRAIAALREALAAPEPLTSDQEKALSAEAKTGPFQHATPSYGNDTQSGETPRLSSNRHAGSTPPAAPASAAPVPDGWVMVPMEPTAEMLAVVRNGPMHETWTEGYCAMIAAAPAAPVVPLTEGRITAIANELAFGGGHCNVYELARAIEAAHGITGASK